MKRFTAILLALLVALLAAGILFTGCGKKKSAGGKTALTFAGTEGASSGQSRMMTEAAKKLNASGRFDVKVYVSGALPGDTDNLVTQARLGVNLVVPSDPGRLASQFKIPDLNILMAPYVISDYTLLEKLPQTELYKKWQAELEAQGIVLVANMFNGFRSFYTTTPVKTVKDLSGLRIRGFGNNMGLALAKYFGYSQTTMNATDIYSAIQAKGLDGCEIQPSTAESYRLYEVTPYLALTKHYMLQSSFVCGKALLDSMPKEDRELFLKIVNETAVKYSAIIASEEQGIYNSLKAKNMTITEVDLAPFQDAIAPLFTNNDLGFTPGLKETLFSQLGL